MTTDQDLIADGVQAVDDEFLEWFVKNPSCESVEVDRNLNYPLDKSWEYKLRIIPQEEPKQEEAGKVFYESADKVIVVKRQETLEEQAQEYFENNIFCDGITEFEHDIAIRSYIAGAKLQAERMYSEEDLRNAYFSGISSTGEGWNGEYADGNSPNVEETFSEGFKEWFEQFKKK
jgi:hypothetical protein